MLKPVLFRLGLLALVVAAALTLGYVGAFQFVLGLLLFAALGSAALFVYFLPTYVARHKRNRRAILVLNLLLGWTLLGWVGALVWANTADA